MKSYGYQTFLREKLLFAEYLLSVVYKTSERFKSKVLKLSKAQLALHYCLFSSPIFSLTNLFNLIIGAQGLCFVCLFVVFWRMENLEFNAVWKEISKCWSKGPWNQVINSKHKVEHHQQKNETGYPEKSVVLNRVSCVEPFHDSSSGFEGNYWNCIATDSFHKGTVFILFSATM